MSGERTERPTPRRRREARRKGQVARSTDLVSALALGLGGLLLASELPRAVRELAGFSVRVWSHPAQAPGATLEAALRTAGAAVLPFVGLLALAGAGAVLVQVGPLVSFDALRPRLERLDPLAGTRRLFSVARLAVVVRAAAALTLAAVVLLAFLQPRLRGLLTLPLYEPLAAAKLLARTLTALLAGCGAALLVPGALDWLLARRRLDRELRMSRDEVRREHKDQEGDPAHKGRRKQAHRALATGPARPLREARALVVNPTHVAVALHHGPDLDVPEVGARGVGEDAAALRAEARRLGIPLVRDVPLARALVLLEPGCPVPEPLWEATAAVLAAVYRAASRPPSTSGARP